LSLADEIAVIPPVIGGVSSQESGGWLMIEIAGEGVAESSAGRLEVVAGEGRGVGSRHDARVATSGPSAG
jgi:hypothetical protein